MKRLHVNMNPIRLWGFSVATAIAMTGSSVMAGTIDFESTVYNDLDPLTNAISGGDGVSILFETGSGAAPNAAAFLAAVGNPVTGFVPLDTPAGGVGGSFFASDEDATNPLSVANHYYLSISENINALSLDVYDARRDGGGLVNDVVRLTTFSDSGFSTVVGSDSYTIDGSEVDGNVVNLSVSGAGFFQYAAVQFLRGGVLTNTDVGTGIDNVNYSVPEPASLVCFLPIVGYALVRRRRKKK
jgi:hypothetical protein